MVKEKQKQMEKSALALELKAELVGVQRGHKFGLWQLQINITRTTGYNPCRNCGLEIHINTNPLPNDIEMGGPAMAENCSGVQQNRGRQNNFYVWGDPYDYKQ